MSTNDTPLHQKAEKIEHDEALVRANEKGAARALTLELELIPPSERRAIYELVKADDERHHKDTVFKYIHHDLELIPPYGPVDDPIKHAGKEIKKEFKRIFGS